MDTIVVVDEFLQKGLVLFQHLVAHVWDVVEEGLILHLRIKDANQDITWEAFADWTVTSYTDLQAAKGLQNIYMGLFTFNGPTNGHKWTGNINVNNVM